MEYEAILSSKGSFTSFSCKGCTIRFRTSDRLERYTKIIEWDKGYIVVMAKYAGLPEMEEYIDLYNAVPVSFCYCRRRGGTDHGK